MTKNLYEFKDVGYVVCGNDAFKKIYSSARSADGTNVIVTRCNTENGVLLPKGKYVYGLFVQHGGPEDYRLSDVGFHPGGLKMKKTMIVLADVAAKAVKAAISPPPHDETTAA